ncbi:putative AAA ATPase [Skeletonema marinoi]|uniref:AAA ATPase n=1 Tax=Skeletonema marinoi TaxID=267567 RepID=A0AAD9D9K7_9STRA|nr:putative AAA ATPase [Skeletonema marinoi]
MGGVLYSLGIVFYQIFSGGELPAELELKQIEERPDAVENGTEEELFEGFNPFLQSGTVDLVAELSMHKHLLSDYKLSDDDSTSYEHDIGIGLLGDGPRKKRMSGDRELVTIYGQSGTGKSLLAHEFGKHVLSHGGVLLSGKFDQLEQGKPFSALASAFNQYCGTLLQNCELKQSKQKLTHQINHALGREAYHLAKLIPNLATILGLQLHSIIHDEGCINAQKRLQYLLCRFVEVISNSSAAPVTLFLDDLQWADSASIEAVNHLLLTGGLATQNTSFFFLGCYREGETDNLNPLWTSLCNNNLVNARSTEVKLDCMDEHTLNRMVSETLCLSPRLTRTLSNVIYHKTKGNQLFVSRLLRALNKEGLLRPSLSRRRWEWNMKKIKSRGLPDDVAIFLTDSLRELPDKVQSALFVLSCFGASSESAFVESQGLDRNILENLEIAVAEGLVDKIDDQYRFAHDRIQEAAYNTTPAQKRSVVHFKYGLELSSLLLGDEDTSASASVLFTAVNQLNLGGPPAVQDKSHYITAAQLNLRAGKKAMEMSDYETAYSYFDSGISFLSKKHWQKHYALSLELYSLAATCALTNSDHTSLKLLIAEVVAKAHFFEDKSSTCCILKHARWLFHPGYQNQLKGGRMTDSTMIMAMKFLGKMETGMTQIMPKSAPHVMQRIIQLSLSHGMSPVSPIGFVHLGSYIAKLGDINEGYHYVKLARSLVDNVGSRESAGEVICFGTPVRAYAEPLQATFEYHDEGYAAALASGDIIQAALNISLKILNMFFAGVNLQTTREKCAEAVNFLDERKMVIFMMNQQCLQKFVLKLIGTDEMPKYTSAEEENILATNNSVRTSNYFQGAFTSFMFRSYDDSKHYAEKYLDCIGNTWANLLLQHAFHAIYIGLISFWVARKSGDGQQWHERGKRSKLALKKWAESSQWTFENKWYLLEAEELYCNNDFDAAKTYYEKAIAAAKSHKFVHEEALACELAGYFHLEQGETKKATELFLLALEKYHEWGAFEKCNSLFKFVEGIRTLYLPLTRAELEQNENDGMESSRSILSLEAGGGRDAPD